MDDIAVLICALFLAVGSVVGYTYGRHTTATDCETLGGFHSKNKVFTCVEAKESKND